MSVAVKNIGRISKSILGSLVALGLFLGSPEPASGGNGNGQAQGTPHIFRVVDKSGKLVGFSLSENLVVRDIDGTWVSFYVQPAEGIFDSKAVYVMYLTTDCSGTRYLSHYSTFSEGTRVGSTLWYPVGASQLTAKSFRVVSSDGPGDCKPAAEVPGVYGIATSVPVDSFSFEPPFRATQ